jgi:5-(carboxyamino)imidazole ribonucleotide mutase
MPKDIPVSTFATGEKSAANAGLFAISLLALSDPEMADRLGYFWKTQIDNINAMTLPELE